MVSEYLSDDADFDQILRRRNDLVKNFLAMDAKITATEIRVIDQLNQDKQKSQISKQEHEQAKDLAGHKAELEIEMFRFKKKYLDTVGLAAKNDN